MRTSVRTIMNVRARQRLNSIRVQGFKCHEIGYKHYTNLKRRLTLLEKELTVMREKYPDDAWSSYSVTIKSLKDQIKEYEKKHNINKKPKKPVIKKQRLMSKVRSLFSRRKR